MLSLQDLSIFVYDHDRPKVAQCSMVNGQWFIVSYDSTNKQKHHKSHRMQ